LARFERQPDHHGRAAAKDRPDPHRAAMQFNG
jgi:hypothetical protein